MHKTDMFASQMENVSYHLERRGQLIPPEDKLAAFRNGPREKTGS